MSQNKDNCAPSPQHSISRILNMTMTTNTESELEVAMQSHTIEYQKHLAIIQDLETTVHHQQILLDQKVIPNSYHPKTLKTNNTALQEEFKKKYEILFMDHLNKVLTSNIISLQMHKATLTSIILQTEQQLSTSPLPKEKIKEVYQKFLSVNNIHHHTTTPELQRKLAEESQPQTSSSHNPNRKRKRRRQKRKRNTPHPQATKISKPSKPFLSKGPVQQHQPP